ncbi:MAG TPA: hypothetical protein VL984_14210 [Acidimicrobiales bacterium]|nr:hypothetical protein [Acidimicrobiales bacterium]
MPETTTSVKAKASTAKLSATLRDEMIASVKAAQQFSLDAVSTWVDMVGKVYPDLPTVPFVPSRGEILEGLGAGFGTLEEVVALQRKFATDLVNVLVPAL